jgi:predicted HTH transcriptional regulator
MDRNLKIASVAAGAGLITLPFGGVGAAIVAAIAGAMVGNSQFPAGEKPWRELEELLNEGEHGRLEFKESLCPNSKRKSAYDGIIKTIAAFANTDGGELLLGVSDQSEITGLSDDIKAAGGKDKFESALRNAIRSGLDANIAQLYRMRMQECSGQWICRIEVQKSSHRVFTQAGGDFYHRDGNQTVRLNAKQLSKLENQDS